MWTFQDRIYLLQCWGELPYRSRLSDQYHPLSDPVFSTFALAEPTLVFLDFLEVFGLAPTALAFSVWASRSVPGNPALKFNRNHSTRGSQPLMRPRNSVGGDSTMPHLVRTVSRLLVVIPLIMLAAKPLPSSGQVLSGQLSPRMVELVNQEGLIVHGLDAGSTVAVGPDSRNDRRAIVSQCQAEFEYKWQIVERQSGRQNALSINAQAVAASIDLLQRARRDQAGLATLSNWHKQFIYDDNASGRIFNCTLGKALEMLGGTPAKATTGRAVPPPVLASSLHETAVSKFKNDADAFQGRFPAYAVWSDRQKTSYSLYNLEHLTQTLAKYRSDLNPSEAANIAGQLAALQADAKKRCPDCRAEYPGGPLAANEPSTKTAASFLAGQNLYEMEKAQRQIDQNVRGVTGAIGRTIHNRANDATACLAVEPTGVKMEWGIEGRYRIRNNCSYPVEASWCANMADCGAGRGNKWNLAPNMAWPIYFADVTNPNIQVGACKSGSAKAPPLGQQTVERNGFDASRVQPTPELGVSLLPLHICE